MIIKCLDSLYSKINVFSCSYRYLKTTRIRNYRFRSEYFKMDSRKLFLISSSKVQGYEYLQYCRDDLKDFLNRHGVKKILFIPYALADYDKYYEKVQSVFSEWGYQMDSIHKFANPKNAAEQAQAIFVGGGNTFLLLHTLYKHNLIETVNKRVIEDGVPYLGSSAGTNVSTVSIHTTNDMPIVYPPSFDAFNLVPFNINPHYLDADLNSTHKGETRQERIEQYVEVTGKPVLAIREGTHLVVEKGAAVLKGFKPALLFTKNNKPQELPVGTDITYLFSDK